MKESRSAAFWLNLGVLSVSLALGMNSLFYLLHIMELSEAFARTAAGQHAAPLGYGLLLFGILSPLAEEILFRRLIFTGLKKIFSVRLSVILSALLFGAYHGNIVQGAYAFLLGLFITAAYELSGDFRTPVYIHGIANTAVFLTTRNPALSGAVGTWGGCAILIGVSAFCMRGFFRLRADRGKTTN